MKKHFYLVLILIGLFFGNLWLNKSSIKGAKNKVSQKMQSKKNDSRPLIFPLPVAQVTPKGPNRLMASVKDHGPRNTHYVNNVSKSFTPDPAIKLDNGHIFAADIGAVAREKYHPGLGELVSEDRAFSYYKKLSHDEASPVAYIPSKNVFRPISSVLHIGDVGEDLRSEILAAGYEEYYFNPKVRLMFIKSTPDQVIALYQNLKNKGLNAELEVLKLPHKGH